MSIHGQRQAKAAFVAIATSLTASAGVAANRPVLLAPSTEPFLAASAGGLLGIAAILSWLVAAKI